MFISSQRISMSWQFISHVGILLIFDSQMFVELISEKFWNITQYVGDC
jgi:hypothetical protein